MAIAAKYAGTCPQCRRPIVVGAMIDYDKTTRSARHEQCPTAPAVKAPVRPAPPVTPSSPGDMTGPITLTYYHHAHALGAVIECKHGFVKIIGRTSRFVSRREAMEEEEINDNFTFANEFRNGGILWTLSARPATMDESYPLREAAEARAREQAAKRGDAS